MILLFSLHLFEDNYEIKYKNCCYNNWNPVPELFNCFITNAHYCVEKYDNMMLNMLGSKCQSWLQVCYATIIWLCLTGCPNRVRLWHLSPKRIRTMSQRHKVRFYSLSWSQLNNRYNQALWCHSIGRCSFGRRTSKFHQTWVPYLLYNWLNVHVIFNLLWFIWKSYVRLQLYLCKASHEFHANL